MRALGDPDAFPSGDIALMRGFGAESAGELEKRAEAWRPWRAYAAIYLWHIAGQKQLQLQNTWGQPPSAVRSSAVRQFMVVEEDRV